MYFATNNDDQLLMRANLATGEVETIGNLDINALQEVEGLSIKWTKDGWSMNVLNREESTPGSGEGASASTNTSALPATRCPARSMPTSPAP